MKITQDMINKAPFIAFSIPTDDFTSLSIRNLLKQNLTMQKALERLQELGKNEMKPDYLEWIFPAKVEKIARVALQSLED